MNKEDLFASAKQTVLGDPPTCKVALIGYNIANNYFGNLIVEAESVLQKIEMPRMSLTIYLTKAFEFSAYGGFKQFPPETQTVIVQCTNNFRARYEPLLKQLELKRLDHHEGEVVVDDIGRVRLHPFPVARDAVSIRNVA